jgi:hypothetical protein
VSRKPSNFKQRDVRCAVAAAQQAGLAVARIEIESGKIVIVTGQPEPPGKDPDRNEWDEAV